MEELENNVVEQEENQEENQEKVYTQEEVLKLLQSESDKRVAQALNPTKEV